MSPFRVRHRPARVLLAVTLVGSLLLAWLAMSAMHTETRSGVMDTGHAMAGSAAAPMSADGPDSQVGLPAVLCDAFTAVATSRGGLVGPLGAVAVLLWGAAMSRRDGARHRLHPRTRHALSPPRLEALGISRT